MTDFVCKAEDEYTSSLQTDKRLPLWKARLSNGEVIVMDDGRPGLDEPSAWIRLKRYCRENALQIEELWLKFRTNEVRNILPVNAKGYFFSKSIIGRWGSKTTLNFYMVGCIHDGKVFVQRWNIPALIYIGTTIRKIENCENCLI